MKLLDWARCLSVNNNVLPQAVIVNLILWQLCFVLIKLHSSLIWSHKMTRKSNKSSRPFRDINLLFTSSRNNNGRRLLGVSKLCDWNGSHVESHGRAWFRVVHGVAVAVHIDGTYQHGAGVSLATEANARAGDCWELYFTIIKPRTNTERETYSAFNFQLEV